jgi:hypothetical protein
MVDLTVESAGSTGEHSEEFVQQRHDARSR